LNPEGKGKLKNEDFFILSRRQKELNIKGATICSKEKGGDSFSGGEKKGLAFVYSLGGGKVVTYFQRGKWTRSSKTMNSWEEKEKGI